MAITVLSTPDLLSLSRNPIEFKLETNNRITTPGVKAQLYVIFQAVAVADESFTLTWLNNSEQLTFKTTPDNSGNQLSDNTSIGSLTAFMERLLIEVKQNYEINRDFSVELDEVVVGAFTYPVLLFTAREAGTDYTLTFAESSSNISQGTNTAGVNEVVRSNFKIAFEVYVYDENGDAELIYEELQEPDENEQSVFNVSAILDPYVNHEFPALNQLAIQVCTDPCRKYFVRYGESFGDVAAVQKMTSSADFYVLVGGLRKQDFASISFYDDVITTGKRFLTWQPNSKVISTDQKEFLYFFVQPNVTALTLRANLRYTDGTSSLKNALIINPVTRYSLLRIPAGYGQLSIAALANVGKTVKSYQLFLTSGLTTYSETYTYTLETECRLPEHYFLFANSTGGVDTLRTYGDHITGLELDFDLSGKTLLSGYSSSDREIIKTGISSEDTFTVSTGYVHTKEYKEYLKELLLSDDVFEIIDDELVPVTILTKKDELFKESDNLYALRFEYAIAIKNNSYSRR